MVDCAKNPLVVPFCTVPGRLVEIQGLGIGLENCQKSLNEYLDSKRRIFPRFYFISTDELLSILGSSEPSAVQNHIIKVGIGWVRFGFRIWFQVGGCAALLVVTTTDLPNCQRHYFYVQRGACVYIHICMYVYTIESCHKS